MGVLPPNCPKTEQNCGAGGAKLAKCLTSVAPLLYRADIGRHSLTGSCESLFCVATLQLRNGWFRFDDKASLVNWVVGTENESETHELTEAPRRGPGLMGRVKRCGAPGTRALISRCNMEDASRAIVQSGAVSGAYRSTPLGGPIDADKTHSCHCGKSGHIGSGH
jgi:hypothetical protein